MIGTSVVKIFAFCPWFPVRASETLGIFEWQVSFFMLMRGLGAEGPYTNSGWELVILSSPGRGAGQDVDFISYRQWFNQTCLLNPPYKPYTMGPGEPSGRWTRPPAWVLHPAPAGEGFLHSNPSSCHPMYLFTWLSTCGLYNTQKMEVKISLNFVSHPSKLSNWGRVVGCSQVGRKSQYPRDLLLAPGIWSGVQSGGPQPLTCGVRANSGLLVSELN